MAYQNMTLDQYAAAIDAEAVALEVANETGRYGCAPEDWRGAFDDGLSPKQALTEELRNA